MKNKLTGNKESDGMEPDRNTLLAVEHLNKSYDGTRVLTDLSLTLPPGTILGLIGENGAGKSTFAKCLLGIVRPDSGSILLDGKAFRPGSAAIAGIPQEFNLVDDLSVAENIFLGAEPRRFGWLDRSRMHRESRERLARLSVELDPARLVGTLSPSEKQMVEIARAFTDECRIVIMDEPTTILNRAETERLFTVMREFRSRGNSILFVSHKLAEVKEICDSIAILRDGCLVDCGRAEEFTPLQLAEKMVGRELHRMFPPIPEPPAEPPPTLLSVEHLSSGRRVRDVTFTLAEGEILGVAGLAGAGRSELAETLYGLRKRDGGRVLLGGREVHFRRPDQAVRAGLSLLSEDRQGSGVLPDFTVRENITLASISRYTRFGLLRRAKTLAAARAYVERFRIRPSDPELPMRSLSGGNQQKAAIARGVDTEPRLFLFDEPTRGVDIAARCDIYEFIRSLADRGVGCLLISSDLEELIGMCRRVLVMRAGSIAGVLSGPEVTEQNIMYLATGVK